MSYDEYIQSEEWRDMRVDAFLAYGTKCYWCGKPATEVHHFNYRKPESVQQLRPVCHPCHVKHHEKDKTMLVIYEGKGACSPEQVTEPGPLQNSWFVEYNEEILVWDAQIIEQFQIDKLPGNWAERFVRECEETSARLEGSTGRPHSFRYMSTTGEHVVLRKWAVYRQVLTVVITSCRGPTGSGRMTPQEIETVRRIQAMFDDADRTYGKVLLDRVKQKALAVVSAPSNDLSKQIADNLTMLSQLTVSNSQEIAQVRQQIKALTVDPEVSMTAVQAAQGWIVAGVMLGPETGRKDYTTNFFVDGALGTEAAKVAKKHGVIPVKDYMNSRGVSHPCNRFPKWIWDEAKRNLEGCANFRRKFVELAHGS